MTKLRNEDLPILCNYLRPAKCTPQLAQALRTFDPNDYSLSIPSEFLDYIDIVREMVSHFYLYQTFRSLHMLP